MAWSNIDIIYGIAITIAELKILFPNLKWGDPEDEDTFIGLGLDTVEVVNEGLLSDAPKYQYNYKYSRNNRWTGQPLSLGTTKNLWVHNYPCCSKLSDTHILIGRVVGDVEPEQFLNMNDEYSLPIWDSTLTFEKLAKFPLVKTSDRDYELTPEIDSQVVTVITQLGIDKKPELYVMADDCYSCT